MSTVYFFGILRLNYFLFIPELRDRTSFIYNYFLRYRISLSSVLSPALQLKLALIKTPSVIWWRWSELFPLLARLPQLVTTRPLSTLSFSLLSHTRPRPLLFPPRSYSPAFTRYVLWSYSHSPLWYPSLSSPPTRFCPFFQLFLPLSYISPSILLPSMFFDITPTLISGLTSLSSPMYIPARYPSSHVTTPHPSLAQAFDTTSTLNSGPLLFLLLFTFLAILLPPTWK